MKSVGLADRSGGRPPAASARRLAVRLDVRRWTPTVQMIAVSICVSAALAVALTVMGYSYASHGLNHQVEAALASDGLVVTQAIDTWNADRLAETASLASLPAIVQLARDGTGASQEERAATEQLVLSQSSVRKDDEDSVVLATLDKTVLFDTDHVHPTDVVPESDYFRAAAAGKSFISGVTISLFTDLPSIYHAVPVHDQQGNVIGVLRSRSALRTINGIVDAARGRAGKSALGVLLDTQGLVISSTDDSWEERPIVPLPAATQARLVADSRWGAHPAPPPLNQPALAKVMKPQGRVIFSWQPAGDTYHAEAMLLGQTDWTYIIALPQSVYDAPALAFLRNAVVGAVIALVAAAVLAVLTARMLDSERKRMLDREAQLTRQVAQLQVAIDEARRERDVKAIVETEFFEDISLKAKRMRNERSRRAEQHAAATSPEE